MLPAIRGHVRPRTGDAFSPPLSRVVTEPGGPVGCRHVGASVLLAPVVGSGSHEVPPHPSFSGP